MCLCLLKVYQKLQKYPGVEKKKKKGTFGSLVLSAALLFMQSEIALGFLALAAPIDS